MGEVLQAKALPGYPDEIGRWLWALQETRRATLNLVEGLDQTTLDWEGPDGQENSIGSLLYHLAIVEMGWLHFDLLLQREFPPEVGRELPFEPGTGTDAATWRIMRVPGVPLAEHLGRLERCRETFLNAFRGMTLDEWRRLRTFGGDADEVSPEWVVFHLIEHEAGHGFQISSLKRRARRYIEGGR